MKLPSLENSHLTLVVGRVIYREMERLAFEGRWGAEIARKTNRKNEGVHEYAVWTRERYGRDKRVNDEVLGGIRLLWF